ncbi:hypothetical protein HYH03_008286 [Edaphochlamys debaryana]|uniref:EGF-like domain-containing protein n=1 Tax=Edaphochlamys debaryana TaxID=47281 RepID=A0A835Y1B1_9CHLO|nr:hypothetical protein HYH03_008286 [Edaphochlamys debaryana]|eukprot:KAG2493469.1 hypothetical protein HYH03_008286 [Edaphochlamys debaryana]
MRGNLPKARRQLAALLDPGPKKLPVALTNTTEAAASQYDHDELHKSNKALGTRHAGHPAACDRSGGKCGLCALTRGSWCEEYFRQDRVPWKPAPRGSKDCSSTKWGPCNGVGNCHYDIGVCQCPAGWKGKACDEPELRPCAHGHRGAGMPLDKPISHIGPDGMDLNPLEQGWTASRCSGFCDAERGSCWCPPSTKHGRKPPPPDSPPWVRYSQKGRPIGLPCNAGMYADKDGKLVHPNWGNKNILLEDLMGPNGWCNVDDEKALNQTIRSNCGCGSDEGLTGWVCSTVKEQTCPNQCSGHGECDAGYCRCHQGWYGHECARKKAGEAMEPGFDVTQRPWLKDALVPVPAAAPEPPPAAEGSAGVGAGAGGAAAEPGAEVASGRMRPFIYVYDMPPEFTSRMHQYKLVLEYCGYRVFRPGNVTTLFADGYSIEVYLHDMLMLSKHRTFDPEEADYFYVPVYFTCWTWPVNGYADMPFWGAPTTAHRYSNGANLWLAAKRWIQSNFPFWDRRGGRDHIWLTNHDEGACYMPTEIYNTSIMLTHWGRMDLNHTSNTAYRADFYSQPLEWPGVLDGKDVRTLYEGHPCYDPRKDLVIPGFKPPLHYSQSPLLGRQPYERDILLYLRGDVGKHRSPNYSRGIRQKLYSLASTNNWAEKYRIYIGEKNELVGNYGEHLARSIFCAVMPGDGYAMRFEDAVLHGCLPLIIMDHTHALFESILDIDSFSLRIRESAVNDHLPNLLSAIAPEQIERMQRKLALVWHRFAYAHGAVLQTALHEVHSKNVAEASAGTPELHPYQPVGRFPVHVDALSTIIQWLHGRMGQAHAAGGAAASP